MYIWKINFRTKLNIRRGICCSPHRAGKYGTTPFYGGSGCRAIAHAHPAGSKNAFGPVGIPLLGRLRRRAINPTLLKEVKAWGEGPLRPKDKNSLAKRPRSDTKHKKLLFLYLYFCLYWPIGTLVLDANSFEFLWDFRWLYLNCFMNFEGVNSTLFRHRLLKIHF